MALTRDVGNSIFGLDELELPPHIIRPWLDGIAAQSAVGTLAQRMPMAYGESQWFRFADHEAQYVGEGQAKAGSEIDVKTGWIKPYKFQKTVRFPVEQLWRDEAYQLGMMQEILTDMVAALGRSLDLGVIHALDPRTGIHIDRMDPALHDAPNVIDLAGKPAYAGIDAAVQAVLAAGYAPNGIALSPALGGVFATQRGGMTEQRLYPDFRIDSASQLEGMRSVVSRTVPPVLIGGSEQDAKSYEPLAGIVGDWNAIRWGIQRSMKTEAFDVGDPDNTGRDLAGHNEVAYRVEVVYGWGIADLAAFALLHGNPAVSVGAGVNLPNATVDVAADTVDVTADTVNVDGGSTRAAKAKAALAD